MGDIFGGHSATFKAKGAKVLVVDDIETFETLRKSSNSNANIPVIILTANAVSGAKEEYEKIGFNGYLSKPINPDELEKSLVEFLPKEKFELTSN